jgi:hypothetical protein
MGQLRCAPPSLYCHPFKKDRGVLLMNQRQKEGEAIARLVDDDGKRTLGWVYLWNTFELGILWLRCDVIPKRVEPPLDPDLLAKAKSVHRNEITDLLERLSKDRENQST